jgi:hypothetical protein
MFKSTLHSLFKEPLVQFLFLGALIFFGYSLIADEASADSRVIVVSRGTVENLAMIFQRTWNRPPDEEELNGLIREHVREEVLAREAAAIGLDKDDIIIRRRLKQKLEFVSQDVITVSEPTEADLQNYLEAHPEKFRAEQRYTFRQVFLDPNKRGGGLETDAEKLLRDLNARGPDTDVSQLSDSKMLPSSFDDMALPEIERQFDREFTYRLADLEIGKWAGPLRSGYGYHLVFVSFRTDGRLPTLAEDRDKVLQAWELSKRDEANEKFYRSLLERYSVTIE